MILGRSVEAEHHPKGVRPSICVARSLDRVTADYPFRVDIETNPALEDEVARAITQALAAPGSSPDPWWQAGVEEALEE